MTQKKDIIGSERQRDLVKKYSTYINKYKTPFFKNVQLNLVQGEQSFLNIKMLEGLNLISINV